ncbi:MAG TPA: S46 family peptidase [bacterium]
MIFKSKRSFLLLNLIFMLIISVSPDLKSAPDEGMWTFDNPPVKQLQERYGFTPTQQWLDHVRLASVRFNDGGSGSFISPNGLVLTNHHVAMGQLQKMSTAEKNYVATGFYAATPAEEAKCPDLELNVLYAMENVTNRVLGVVKQGMNESEALKAREAEKAKIEQEYLEKTGLTCNAVGLYQGGEYWAYQYKRYTDVRLVMAPERQIAFWGGDDDNFTYPRYDLDMAFFRVYENEQPIQCEHYLKWNASGAADGELVFVSGHPGGTNRLNTYDQLAFLRDFQYPMRLNMINKRLDILRDYAKMGPEQERRALGQIFGLENSKKALTGEYQGLLDPKLMEKAKKDEDAFRQKIQANPEWKKQYAGAWDVIKKLMKERSKTSRERFYQGLAINSRFYGIANQIVLYVAEVNKPDIERLNGYHDSQLEQLRFRLFSPAPIYKDIDEATTKGMMQLALAELGPNDPYLKIILNGRTPADVTKEMLAGTKLDDANLRKSLIEGGEAAVAQSTDPFIVLARKLEPMQRKQIEDDKKNFQSVVTPASEKIAQARFAVYGKNTYPDATFTLRLSYGAVKGYPLNGTKAPYKTTLYGLYDRSLGFDQQAAYALPQRFWDRKEQLDLSTPVNFVSTHDIIGGNSGSPVINKNAELVGLIFDGNIESLVGRFVYDDASNRAVSVHSAFIIEALQKLYDANKLADEILGN